MKHTLQDLFRVYFIIPLILLSVFVSNNTQPNTDVVNKIMKSVDLAQVKCLATNIFYEARAESVAGQAAVARVVVNRVNHGFATTPCKVINQVIYVDRGYDEKVKVCQFSWVCENPGKPNEHDPKYKQAFQIAYEVLVFDMYKEVIPKSVLFFHALHVDPAWPYRQVKKIGNHIFYSKK